MRHLSFFTIFLTIILYTFTGLLQAFPCSPVLIYTYNRCRELKYKVSDWIDGYERNITISTSHDNGNNTKTEHDLLIYSADRNRVNIKVVTTTLSNDNVVLDQKQGISINYEHPAHKLAIPTKSSCIITKYLTAQEIADRLVDFLLQQKE